MNTTNNISHFLLNLDIVETQIVNPAYSQIFNQLSDNDKIDGVSYIIEENTEVFSNRLLLKTSDLIKIENAESVTIGNNSFQFSSCLLPVNTLKEPIKIKGDLKITGYALSIKNRILLKNMVDNCFYNKEGLCFQKGKFLGIYKNLPSTSEIEHQFYTNEFD